MILDLLQTRPGSDDVADVCVVGAGAAGICLALELARQGKSVVMVEGGGREIEEAAQEPYQSELTGLEHQGIHTGRFRAHGGTTTKWGGQILELDAEDLEKRSWVMGSGWPFSKQELAGHYQRALRLEGVAEAIQDDGEIWRRLGLPVPSFESLCPYFSRWCPEPNFAVLHRKALEESERVRIWLHANAVELLTEDEAVKALRCRTQDGQGAIFRARQFCFCMGTIECVRFFLQPRENQLSWNESGLLGRHFQDHIDVNTAKVVPRNRRRFADLFDNVVLEGLKYHPKLRLSPEEQAKRQTLNCAATMVFESDVEQVLTALKGTARLLLQGRWREFKIADALQMLSHAPLLTQQGIRFLRKHRIWNPANARVKLRVHCEQEPFSSSSITLSMARDSLGLQRTRLDWRIAETELRTVREYTRVAAESLKQIAGVNSSPELMTDDASLVRACNDSNHHMGGMRMNASPRQGVVTPDLRLHGTQNAYICSGAVFPSSGFSNPTHTLLALAMRLADHLASL